MYVCTNFKYIVCSKLCIIWIHYTYSKNNVLYTLSCMDICFKVLLNESAQEMTCRAPRLNICGAGSNISVFCI